MTILHIPNSYSSGTLHNSIYQWHYLFSSPRPSSLAYTSSGEQRIRERSGCKPTPSSAASHCSCVGPSQCITLRVGLQHGLLCQYSCSSVRDAWQREGDLTRGLPPLSVSGQSCEQVKPAVDRTARRLQRAYIVIPLVLLCMWRASERLPSRCEGRGDGDSGRVGGGGKEHTD